MLGYIQIWKWTPEKVCSSFKILSLSMQLWAGSYQHLLGVSQKKYIPMILRYTWIKKQNYLSSLFLATAVRLVESNTLLPCFPNLWENIYVYISILWCTRVLGNRVLDNNPASSYSCLFLGLSWILWKGLRKGIYRLLVAFFFCFAKKLIFDNQESLKVNYTSV